MKDKDREMAKAINAEFSDDDDEEDDNKSNWDDEEKVNSTMALNKLIKRNRGFEYICVTRLLDEIYNIKITNAEVCFINCFYSLVL